MGMNLSTDGYDTDKCPVYLRNYEVWFATLRDQPVRLLELGINRGGSLLLWRDYFERGVIAGLDLEPSHVDDASGRVHIYQGRQEDTTVLDKIGAELGPFDIVIDDASHLAAPTRISFWHMFERHLKPGGLYAIEDWGTGYWDSWPDGRRYELLASVQTSERSVHAQGMVGFVKELVDECGVEDRTRPGLGTAPYRECRFERLQISPGHVLVVKRT